MDEDVDGTSNLIAFPGKPADDASADRLPPSSRREREMLRRLETIAEAIGVPVATFLSAAGERSVAESQTRALDSAARSAEMAELLQLFGRISDGPTRDQYLKLLRLLAASQPEASSPR